MSCDETTALLSDRLTGLLTGDDERRLDAHLAGCPACRAEAEAIGALWADLAALDADVPHDRMRARFHAALAAYEERARGNAFERLVERVLPRQPALRLAAAVLLLIVGAVIGRQLGAPAQAEVAALREEIRAVALVLLDHQSASERLRGVEWARRGDSDRALEALLDTVRHDPNLNVRLAAVEALGARLDRPLVREGLTDALERQDAPLMQVTLAGVLLEGGVEGFVPAAQRMLERDDVDSSVRDYLRTALDETGGATGVPEA